MDVIVEKKKRIWTVIINRPQRRNAVDKQTAQLLADAFRDFDKCDEADAAVLWGAGGNFCAGADLQALARGQGNNMHEDMSLDGPMGPSRMRLGKPVIAAVSGYAVAGGLELACWADLRVVERDAVFGVYCRRFGVPLVDGGTKRLARLVGLGRALDMILTARSVGAEEALAMGLANYVVEPGTARAEAEKLAAHIAGFPQVCMRSDRMSVYEGFDLPLDEALAQEFAKGLAVVRSGETLDGATRFSRGQGRVVPPKNPVGRQS